MREWMRKGLYLCNRLVLPLDSLFRAHAAINSPALFIVGPPRSGTTLAYQIVTQQFRLGYMIRAMNYVYGLPNLAMRLALPCIRRPEPVFISKYGLIPGWCAPAESGNFWCRWFPCNDNQGHYVDPRFLDEEKYIGLRRNVDSLAAIVGAPMVFKCVYLSMVVGVLAQIFPQARFLVIRRDMLPTAMSIFERRLKQKVPSDWWSVKPPHFSELRKMPMWKQVAEQVFYTNKIIDQDLRQYAPNRYLEIEYEALCARPREIIISLQELMSEWGDIAYNDMRIPDRFPVSQGVSLSNDIVHKIQDHLSKLQTQVMT